MAEVSFQMNVLRRGLGGYLSSITVYTYHMKIASHPPTCLFPAFMFIHKKNELFLYYCIWQSELGHQGSKGSKYMGLKSVSPIF